VSELISGRTESIRILGGVTERVGRRGENARYIGEELMSQQLADGSTVAEVVEAYRTEAVDFGTYHEEYLAQQQLPEVQ